MGQKLEPPVIMELYSEFLSQLYNKKPLTIVGDGKQQRDFTYVSDVMHLLY